MDYEKSEYSFKDRINLLPSQVIEDSTKGLTFPIEKYAGLTKEIILSENDISAYLSQIKEVLAYEDMSQNIWKALRIALYDFSQLSGKNVENALSIINCIEKPKGKDVEMGPVPYFCQVTDGVISKKEVKVCIKIIWKKLAAAEDLTTKQKQMLLLALYEHLMPRMDKPVFLIDYFITSLNSDGPLGILALQGIFTLMQKFNMNYPDVYKKIYSMLDFYVFDINYKSRFYYLTDMFLSSLHLPEALIAGFIKKFARLSLIAPPTDIVIMMTFIVNLMIRHPGLKTLMHKPLGNMRIRDDPYNIDEKDPALSQAISSSLWEVKLLQQHILPSVSSSAMFIENPLPSVERDISLYLDLRDDEIFGKELKKKTPTPPLSYERPSSLTIRAPRNGIELWSFSK